MGLTHFDRWIGHASSMSRRIVRFCMLFCTIFARLSMLRFRLSIGHVPTIAYGTPDPEMQSCVTYNIPRTEFSAGNHVAVLAG